MGRATLDSCNELHHALKWVDHCNLLLLIDPTNHFHRGCSLWQIRGMTAVWAKMFGTEEKSGLPFSYVDFSCPSIAPERLVRASLIQVLFSIRSKPQLIRISCDRRHALQPIIGSLTDVFTGQFEAVSSRVFVTALLRLRLSPES